MGWLTNVLLPGRLRTGPTALLPERPDPKTLLAIAQSADPDARFDGDDIVVGGSRILAAAELDGETLRKLGVTDEERMWACRLSAEGPLPMDYFDKSLSEGVAYRLGGWSLCRGEPTDLAGSDLRAVRVYLPAAPSPEEVVALLGEVIRPVDSVDADKWPDGELLEGIVHVTVDGGVVTDVYAGADMMLTLEASNRIPPAAKAHWPYLTEIVIMRLSAIDTQVPASPDGETAEAEEAESPGAEPRDAEPQDAESRDAEPQDAEPQDARAEDAATVDGRSGTGDDADVTVAAEGAADARDSAEDAGDAADSAGDDADDADASAGSSAGDSADDRADDRADDGADDVVDDTALVERATVALVLANRLQGIATDQGGFQLAEAEDVLPGRYAGH
ncbi:hypothetical protein [Planotetraspora kaengkrachanensis]|uniref:Uncharacterized protein n=1 Tax=Planotetraspora kaengkrachanensis TaxID=575193 RepID=A0A8J3Q177_9ACTN|nr:hypothetical protein [Planotetraspora kaengkrachanensis]GIG84855.1 hypothetical protein Pka01_79820 [Planotetraspora kaengkrachanensis]